MALGIGWKNVPLQSEEEQVKQSLTYFWVIERSDGTFFPEYDFITSEQNQYSAVELIKDIAKVHWYPFGEEFAQSIYERHGLRVIPTNNPVLTCEIPNGGRPKMMRRHFRTKFTYYLCKDCNDTIYWGNGEVPLECPNCGAINRWNCNTCKVEIEHPIFLPDGEARCPICEAKNDPRGCVKDEHLVNMVAFEHSMHYCIGVDGMEFKEYTDSGELYAIEKWDGREWKVSECFGEGDGV